MSLSRRQLIELSAATVSATVCGAQSEQVDIIVPDDGGTPRDPSLITRLGAREFRVRAAVEEGRSRLRHAVSRVDLVLRNHGAAADVLLHLDLSADGTRTDFDSSPGGGMPTRDYVFIQAPGQEWRRVDGTTEGWVATVRVPLAPGETKVGLSPWYIYGDYLAFVGC